MSGTSAWTRALPALVGGLALAAVVTSPAMAYVGPGAGLTAIGAILALIVTLFLAVAGLVWYPVKRLLRKRRPAGTSERREDAAPAVAKK